MKNVGDKPESLRRARATARIDLPPECMARIREGVTEKGDLLATARIAGIMAAKRTDTILPLCHPLPLQAAEVSFRIANDHVVIETEVQTLGSTGVEMEALCAASVAALTLYDMLKPHTDPLRIVIHNCRLLEKTGGKSQHARRLADPVPALLLAMPKSSAADTMHEALIAAGFAPVRLQRIAATEHALDEALQQALVARTRGLVISLGGVDPQGRTVAALRPHLDRELPGLMETARAYAQRRVPQAMFHQGLAGLVGETLVLTLPGETEDALRAWTPLLPGLVGHFNGAGAD